MYNIDSKLYGNRLCVKMMFQSRFIDSNKCTPLTLDVDGWGPVCGVGLGLYKNCVFSTQLCCESQTVLKIKFSFKKVSNF